jgi:hypothetical protein
MLALTVAEKVSRQRLLSVSPSAQLLREQSIHFAMGYWTHLAISIYRPLGGVLCTLEEQGGRFGLWAEDPVFL